MQDVELKPPVVHRKREDPPPQKKQYPPWVYEMAGIMKQLMKLIQDCFSGRIKGVALDNALRNIHDQMNTFSHKYLGKHGTQSSSPSSTRHTQSSHLANPIMLDYLMASELGENPNPKNIFQEKFHELLGNPTFQKAYSHWKQQRHHQTQELVKMKKQIPKTRAKIQEVKDQKAAYEALKDLVNETIAQQKFYESLQPIESHNAVKTLKETLKQIGDMEELIAMLDQIHPNLEEKVLFEMSGHLEDINAFIKSLEGIEYDFQMALIKVKLKYYNKPALNFQIAASGGLRYIVSEKDALSQLAMALVGWDYAHSLESTGKGQITDIYIASDVILKGNHLRGQAVDICLTNKKGRPDRIKPWAKKKIVEELSQELKNKGTISTLKNDWGHIQYAPNHPVVEKIYDDPDIQRLCNEAKKARDHILYPKGRDTHKDKVLVDFGRSHPPSQEQKEQLAKIYERYKKELLKAVRRFNSSK